MGNGFLQNFVGTIVYLVAQFLGMFVAATLSYWVYSINERHVYEHLTEPLALLGRYGNLSFDNAVSKKNYEFSCLYSTCPSEQPNSQVKVENEKKKK